MIGLVGVILGLAGSAWTTLWTNRQNRRNLEEGRLVARQEEASREIRQALISIHHLKGELSRNGASAGHDELVRLIHTIDTHAIVLASAELRARLEGATLIMWHWKVLRGSPGNPVWHAVSDASECVGAHLRGESLPAEPKVVRHLRGECEALELDAENDLNEIER